MFLGTKSIHALQQVLNGIDFAERFHDIPEQARFGGFDSGAFEKWVDETFNTKRLSVNSFHLARELSGSDAAGFDLWFEWYDLFHRDSDPTERS